jgi:phosphohistidine phosphatase
MRLYFLRHAEALDGEDDAARPLSPHGRKQSKAMAEFLRQAGVKFDRVMSSPLVRAHQTAEIVVCSMGGGGKVKLEIADALRNETSEAQWNRWLPSLREEGHVLLVGHEPSLAEHVRSLLGMAHTEALRLPKGALACVESDDGHSGRLKYLVTPRSLGL